jgi:hypothetical protein
MGSAPLTLATGHRKRRWAGEVSDRRRPLPLKCLASLWAGAARLRIPASGRGLASQLNGSTGVTVSHIGVDFRAKARSAFATMFVLIALAGLAVGATHGARQQLSLASSDNVRAWQVDARYWSCLDAQARSLADPGVTVWLDYHNLGQEILLQKVFAPWTVVVAQRQRGSVWVSLRSRRGPGTCLGSVIQGTRPGPRGAKPTTRDGTGGSFPGPAKLPSTPL